MNIKKQSLFSNKNKLKFKTMSLNVNKKSSRGIKGRLLSFKEESNLKGKWEFTWRKLIELKDKLVDRFWRG